jgi:hypothetical protein
MGKGVQPGDVVRFRRGRTGHVIASVGTWTASTVCGVIVGCDLIEPGSVADGAWIAPPGTPLCRGCRRRLSTARAERDIPEVVARASFGEPVLPYSVPRREEVPD